MQDHSHQLPEDAIQKIQKATQPYLDATRPFPETTTQSATDSQMVRQPIIDAHTHLFPTKIAAKATSTIGEFYGLPMMAKGTAADLVVRSRAMGSKYILVCSTATHPGQSESINDYIHTVRAENRRHRMQDPSLPQFIAFGTAYPAGDQASIAKSVEQVLALGLSGIKLHSDFQCIAADSEGVFTLCRLLDGRLPLLLHAGDQRYRFSAPERIARLARAFPNQTFIAAHFGGYSVWPQVLSQLADLPNVCTDTSSSLMFLSSREAMKLIGGFGADRVLFGSDYPMWDPAGELERVLSLPLTAAEQNAILYENARRLLNLA